ncbi:MAG: HAMP domain-containing sensor histidine kinase [Lachnospiraceae bacterium]|nr:HAMP domain-containing sensor histidine kinase [Lachnospiraceae bacterium]
MVKKEKKIVTFLWNNYIFIIVIAILLIIIPYLLMTLVSGLLANQLVSSRYTAERIMCDDYNKMDIREIIDNHGGVEVVKDDLTVIPLGGQNSLNTKQFTKSEWTDFLQKVPTHPNGICYSIAYHEKGGFFVVVEFPTPFYFKIDIGSNTDSVDYVSVANIMTVILLIYIFILVLGAIIYSKHTSKIFLRPIRTIKASMKDMENETPPLTALEPIKIKEFHELQSGFEQLSEKLQEQKQERFKLQENRNRLIRDISHDLKNPLASIQGYAEILLKQMDASMDISIEMQKNYLQIIYSNSLRANQLISSLFLYSKLESTDFILQLEKTDLCEFLRENLINFIPIFEEHHFEYELSVPNQEIFLNFDRIQMDRLLNNLYDNAVKYNQDGIQISISVETTDSNVLLTISDNGIGIDPEAAKDIFMPFQRVDEKVRNSQTGGSGLGLAIVKKIVELHNGTISLMTQPNKGCQFVISFPR